MRNFSFTLAAVVAVLVISLPARATPLPPGAVVASDASPETGTAVASASGSFSSTKLVGSWKETVFTEIGGTLDFDYQITITKGDLGRFTADGFSGFLVSASQFATGPGFVAGTSPAGVSTTADRTSDGDVVGYNYTKVIAPPAYNTYVAIVRTNATAYTDNDFSVIDALTFSFTALGPAAPVPEPSSLVLLGGLGVGVGAVAVRRWLKRRPVIA